MNALPPASASDPVFVVGAPRSGKTSLARTLARHSYLWGSAMESFLLPELFGSRRLEELHARLLERPSPTWLRVQRVGREELLRSVALGIDALFASRSGGRRWIDHTTGNVFMLDTLFEMFPGAVVVHVVRDGRLAVQSMLDAGGDDGFRPRWSEDFRAACELWSAAVEAGMDACARHPERCLAVTLDDLSSRPDASLRRVFEFVGVPFEDAPLRFWQRRIVRRWEGYESSGSARWSAWSDEERSIFSQEAGATYLKQGGTAAEIEP